MTVLFRPRILISPRRAFLRARARGSGHGADLDGSFAHRGKFTYECDLRCAEECAPGGLGTDSGWRTMTSLLPPTDAQHVAEATVRAAAIMRMIWMADGTPSLAPLPLGRSERVARAASRCRSVRQHPRDRGENYFCHQSFGDS